MKKEKLSKKTKLKLAEELLLKEKRENKKLTIYDPCAESGSILSSSRKYVKEKESSFFEELEELEAVGIGKKGK